MAAPAVILVPAGYGHAFHRQVIRALMKDSPASLLVDCRLVPRSRWAAWGQAALQRCYGERYLHVPALGNRWYRVRGRIELVDLQAGIQQVVHVVQRDCVRLLILLCGCADERRCHRRVIVPALEEALQRAEMGFCRISPEQWAVLWGKGALSSQGGMP